MRFRIPIGASIAAALVAMAATPGAALAQSPPEPWQFRGQVYLWLPSVDGQTNFPPSSGGGGASVDMSDYFSLGNMQFTFMGSLEARKGRWGFWTDVIYLNVGGDKSASRDATVGRIGLPAGVAVNADLNIKSWVWTLAGSCSHPSRKA